MAMTASAMTTRIAAAANDVARSTSRVAYTTRVSVS